MLLQWTGSACCPIHSRSFKVFGEVGVVMFGRDVEAVCTVNGETVVPVELVGSSFSVRVFFAVGSGIVGAFVF